MVDFEKLLSAPKRPRLTWHYVCLKCKTATAYVQRMPDSHLRCNVYRRCRGLLVLVRVTPEDDRLVRCPSCLAVGRHDPRKGVGWVDPACATCGGDGAVPREVPA